MMGNVRALALSTFRETVRDRIFYLVAVFGFVMLASTAVLSPLTVGAQGKIMSDVGLAAMVLSFVYVVEDSCGQCYRERGQARDLFDCGQFNTRQASKPFEKNPPPFVSDSGDGENLRGDCPFGSSFPAIRDGEPVRFVPRALQESQRRCSSWKANTLSASRDEDLFISFGEAGKWNVDTHRLQGLYGGAELPFPSVDDHEVG